MRRVYEWYVAGVAVAEVRRRLIESAASQREATSFGKGERGVAWAKGVIQKLLHDAIYTSRRMVVKLKGGNQYELSLPHLLPPIMPQHVREWRDKNKTMHLRNVKHNYLIAGLAYCEGCKVKLGTKVRYHDGKPSLSYTCQYHNAGYVKGAESGCCRTVGAKKFDGEVWAETWRLLSDDDYFERQVANKVLAMCAVEQNAEAEVARIESVLDDIAMKRQQVMNWALDRKITAADMETKLAALTSKEAGLRREPGEKSLLLGNRAEKLIEFANRYRAKLRRGGAFLNAEPTSPEMAAEQFMLRRVIVEAVVVRVDRDAVKRPTVHFLPTAANESAGLDNFKLREFTGPHPTLLDTWQWGKLTLSA